MSDFPGGDAALAAIHGAFAKPVHYFRGSEPAQEIAAVRTHGAGDLFMDHQQNVRQLAFEIHKAAIFGEPEKGDRLIEQAGDGARWSVIEVIDRDEIDAWMLMVKSA